MKKLIFFLIFLPAIGNSQIQEMDYVDFLHGCLSDKQLYSENLDVNLELSQLNGKSGFFLTDAKIILGSFNEDDFDFTLESGYAHYSLNHPILKTLRARYPSDPIESDLSVKIDFQNEYVPKLKLDVLFAFEKGGQVHLILIEAKYLSQLALQNYSQLSGYLQVAKNISTGILVLINKGYSANRLSNDFSEIIQLEKLPMDWTQLVKSKQYQFQTGIVTFQPGNGIEWIDTSELSGISSFQQLAELIENQI
jgi:hypothetical protein